MVKRNQVGLLAKKINQVGHFFIYIEVLFENRDAIYKPMLKP
jgi:hypothetical protein